MELRATPQHATQILLCRQGLQEQKARRSLLMPKPGYPGGSLHQLPMSEIWSPRPRPGEQGRVKMGTGENLFLW